MAEKRYRIVFKGELAYGFELEEVRANIRELSKYNEATLDKLFSESPVTLKDNLSHDLANKYKKALDQAGAVCTVEEIPEAQTKSAPAAKVDTVQCPNCGTEQDKGLTCVHCGIAFAGYHKIQERQAAAEKTRPAATSPRSPEPPPAASLMTRVAVYFAKHPEQAFIFKAFLVIAGIIFISKYLTGLLALFILLFPVLFLIYIRFEAMSTDRSPMEVLAQHITFMPIMYAEGERKKEGVAWVTYSIIVINILIFYGFELNVDANIIFNHLIFLPLEPNIFNVPCSLISSIFLHNDGGHLWGNMLFLWAIGTVLEKRIGWQKFLVFYFIAGIAANLMAALVTFVFFGTATHGLGASGAIAGAMGLFAIRCYFKSMVFPLPILGIFSLIFPVSLKVRLNSLVIIGLFFLADLSGGIGQLTGEQTFNIGHWAHIGGMICGIILGTMFKLSEGAVEERHQEIGSQALSKGGDLFQAEESLRLALQKNPDNVETMILLARLLSKFWPTEEGESFFRKGMGLLSKTRPKEAAETFKEYYGIYFKGTDPETMFRLVSSYRQEQDNEWTTRCLELLSDDTATPPAIREKAMFQCARQMESIGNLDTALHYYRQFVDVFPESPLQAKAMARLNPS